MARYIIKELSQNKDNRITAIVSSEKQDFASDLYQSLKNVSTMSKDDFFTSQKMQLNHSVVIHTAFTRNNTDGYEICKSLQYSYKLFQFCKTEKVKGIINFSSRSVYKEPEPGKLNDENSELYLCGLISTAKYASELLLLSTFEGTGIKHTSVRIASVNELKTDNTIVRPLNVFVDCVINGKDIKVFNGNQIMSFIDPRDVARAISLLCNSNKEWNHLYNIGPNRDCTCKLIEMAKKVVEIGTNLGYNRVGIDIIPKEIVQTAGLDISRFQQDFGFTPKFSLDDMILSLFNMKRGLND